MADVPKDIMEAARAVTVAYLADDRTEVGAKMIVGFKPDVLMEKIASALLSERERRTAQGVTITRALGSYGSAFDPPGTKRAYTYAHQPGNVPAWRLGEAMRAAVPITGGDHIDSGLGLLKALEEKGFGVFEIDAAPSLSTSAGGGE